MLATLVGALPLVQQPTEPAPKLAIPPTFTSHARIVLKPGQACAIPLLNALPRNWNHDKKMVVPVPQQPTKDIVQPPAPSCDDVK